MHSCLILFFSSFASFIGSLQPGPVNLFVIETTLNRNRKSAYWVAFGGIIPEFIYCSMAVYSGSYFMRTPNIFFVFKILLIIILIVVSIYYFLKKHTLQEINIQKISGETKSVNFFIKGFSLAILNLQLLPFWIFVMVYFNSINFLALKSQLDKITYIFGAGFGAFILLMFIILTINKLKYRIQFFINNKYYYKSLALLFMLIALQQLTTLV